MKTRVSNWRRWGIWLVAAGALAGVGVLFYRGGSWHGLPYRDSFASGRTADWTAYGGNWNVVDGAIKNDSNERGAKFVTGSSHWRSYTAEADVQLLGPGDSGLMVRASDVEEGVDSYNGYYAGLRSIDGTLVLGRAEHGWIEYPPKKMPGGVSPGLWYHLKISVLGCDIRATATARESDASATVAARDADCPASGMVGLRSMGAGGIWRNVSVRKVSAEEAAALTSSRPPAATSLFPTNQGDPRVHSGAPLTMPVPPLRATQPLTSIQSLRLFSISRPARVVVRGVIILTDPLFVQDATGGVQVDSATATSHRVGDEVEVEGDVVPRGLGATLRNAVIHPLGGMSPVPPISVTADQAATGAYNAMYIEVEGTLTEKVTPSVGSAALELRDGQQAFGAITNSTMTRSSFRKLESKSVLRLRGVCLTDPTYTHSTVPFVVVLTSPEDIKIIQGPPWWSVEHLTIMALVMLGFGFVAHFMYSRARQWRMDAVLDERERIAEEMHDTLAQSFAGIGFQLRAIRNRISRDSAPIEQGSLLRELNVACELIRHSHDEARRSITSLRPDATEAGGLLTALELNARQLLSGGHAEVVGGMSGEVRPIPFRVLDTLFRIGQESIANAVQHGHPTEIRIQVNYDPRSVALVIEDNGCGFPANQESAGFGIPGMRRRAEDIGGRVDIRSMPGKGSTVTVTAPAPPRESWFRWLIYYGKAASRVGQRANHE